MIFMNQCRRVAALCDQGCRDDRPRHWGNVVPPSVTAALAMFFMKELRLLCGEEEGDDTLIEAVKTKELCQLGGFSFKSIEDDELLATIAGRKTLKNLKKGTGLKKLTPEILLKSQKPLLVLHQRSRSRRRRYLTWEGETFQPSF
ncbi:hypothetical protein PIB30_062580 [Stylosanthes scabra]|uniref:Uncharacterized protein n=1 Tax=Stylosanthes scabra TaxID=79078 RepID=A0ABU6RLD9_9FABA|nr:hypothetical protein [Stylosanthes scabra]